MELFSPVSLQEALHKDLSSLVIGTPQYYLGEVLKSTILKKYVPPGQSDALHRAAIQDFLERNQSFKPIDLLTHRDVLNDARNTLHTLFLSGEYQTNILTLDACVNFGYAGPGASRSTRFTDFVRKMFCSDLSVSDPSLYRHYLSSLSERWYQAESSRTRLHSLSIVEGSALNSVPKDSSKNRVICTEPSLNMFYQLGAKYVLEGVLLKNYKFDMSKQPSINKLLACSGSITGLNATLDLKNASDSLSLELINYLYPSETTAVLHSIRSKVTQFEGATHELKMISTMGNGFTFPLMTLTFIVLLDSYLKKFGDRYTPYRDGVFGDDIILPAHHSSGFTELLNSIGFEVNLSKSFSTGFFRESCGGDYLHGHDVRGVYLKRMDYEADIYSAFNRLIDWGTRHGIDLSNALAYLRDLVRFRPVPLDESDIAGFKIPSEFLRSPKRDDNGALYYRCIETVTRSFKVADNFSNPFGALVGALGGYLRDGRSTVRDNDRSFKVSKRKCTPSWDFCVSPYYNSRELGDSWRRLFTRFPA